jgi:cytochrome c oxidase cbb3-type subunit 3/ubiquinol-cytochrome c reductase cytochrome c subunit
MRRRFLFSGLLLAGLLALAGCSSLPGKPRPGPEVPRPDSVLNPVVLYNANCAGCHGAEGKYGPAMALSDPVYLAIVDDDTLRSTISKGRPGTAMSAFAQKEGGMLTDEQINSIIRGIRERWGRPDATAGVTTPPYAARVPGNPQPGEAAYATFCASCHGSNGKGGPKAGSVTNPAYLSLISDQGLRTIVITGRPDFEAPDWRGDVPGRPMTDQEISDVVAWLSSQRPKKPGESYPANSSPGGVH